MDKTLQIVEEITEEMSNIRQLLEKVQTKYQIIGALLLSAKALVPKDRWEAFLHANFGIDVLCADKVINADGEVVDNELYQFNSLNGQANTLAHKTKSIGVTKTTTSKQNKKKNVRKK